MKNRHKPVRVQQGPLIQPYHASLGEDIPPSSVHRCALAGVSVTETAASDHHVVKRVVIFVLGVSAFSPQQSVAQREETSEVDTNICQGEQI